MMKNYSKCPERKSRIPLAVSVCIIALFLGTFLLGQSAECGNKEIKRISLSVPDIKIGNKDRIVEFKATIVNGFVVSVPRIPPGWFFRINLPYQWKTNVVAGSIIGVADLLSDKADYFNDFLIIEYIEDKDEELRIEVEVTVDRYAGGRKVLRFGMGKLGIKKVDDTGK